VTRLRLRHRSVRAPRRRRATVVVILLALSLVSSACGSRLAGGALKLAEGQLTGGRNGTSAGGVVGGTSGGTSAANGGSDAGAATASAGSAASSSGAGASGAASSTASSCNSSNNGGSTATGVTANQISIGNITSITGVAPGLTKSAQQATEAFADYVNSTGGICGRMLKVDAYDDGNTSSANYSDAEQAWEASAAFWSASF